MTRFLDPSFSVGGHKAPENCKCEWIDSRGNCVLCGKPEQPKKEPENTRRKTELP